MGSSFKSMKLSKFSEYYTIVGKVMLIVIIFGMDILWVFEKEINATNTHIQLHQIFKLIVGIYLVGAVILWIQMERNKKVIRYLQLYSLIASLAIGAVWVLHEIDRLGVEVFIQSGSLSLVNGLAFSMLLFLMTSGFFLIFGLADIINFAHGAFFMLGGFMGYEVYLIAEDILIGVPFLNENLVFLSFLCFVTALIGSTLILGSLGAVIEVVTIRKLFGKPISQILLTTGFLFIILQLTEIIWGPAIFTYNYVSGSQTAVFWLPREAVLDLGSGMRFEMYRIFIIIFGLAIALIMFLVLSRTRIGLIITAGIEDSEMVQALGIDTKKVFTLVFSAGAALAGLAGAVAVPQVPASLAVAGNFLIYAFIIVVIGGAHFGRLSGTFWASLIVGLSFTFCQFFFPGFEGIILFILLLLVLAFKPGGLTGEPM